MARSAILSVRIVGDGAKAERSLDRVSNKLDATARKGAKSGVELSRMYDGLDAASGRVLKVAAAWTVARSAISQVSAVGKGVLPVVGVLGVLPGALAAGAAAAATLKVATAGVGDALSAAGTDAKKYAEAVAGMPPAMRASVDAMAAAKAAFASGVVGPVQAAAWDGLATRITRVTTGALPQLRTGMVAVAGDGNRMARGLLDAAAAGNRMGVVRDVFAATHRTAATLAPAIEPAVTGVLRLVGASARLIPGFDGAASAAQRFNLWTARITSNGSFEAWFHRGGAAASQLWSVLRSAGSILLSVANAAANAGGAGGLGGLATALARVAEIVARPEIQTQMTESFTRANMAMGLVLRVLVALAPALAGLAPYLVTLAAGWRAVSAAQIAWRAGAAVAPLLVSTGTAAASAGGWILRMGQAYRSTAVAQSAFSGSAGVVGGRLRAVTDAMTSGTAAAGRWAAAQTRAAAAATAGAARSAAAWTASSARTAAAWTAAGARSAAAAAAAGAKSAAAYSMVAARATWAGARMAAAWLVGMGPVGWVIAAVLGVIAIFVTLYNKVTWFRNGVNAAWAAVSRGAQVAGGAIRSALGGALNWIHAKASAVVGGVSRMLGNLTRGISVIRGKLGSIHLSAAAEKPQGFVPFVPPPPPGAASAYVTFGAGTITDALGSLAASAAQSRRPVVQHITNNNIRVDGALDPNETARKIRDVLNRSDARDGITRWGQHR